MSQLSEYWMGTPHSVIQYDLLEITHPDFLSTIRIVRNAEGGLEVVHEGGGLPVLYQYVPLELAPLSASPDMTQAMSVALGDLGDEVQTNVRAVTERNGMGTRPVVIHRTYLSTDLTVPLYVSTPLEITDVSTTKRQNSFEARARATNSSRTGQTYSVDKFQMLAAFK